MLKLTRITKIDARNIDPASSRRRKVSRKGTPGLGNRRRNVNNFSKAYLSNLVKTWKDNVTVEETQPWSFSNLWLLCFTVQVTPCALTQDMVKDGISLLCRTGNGLSHAFVKLELIDRWATCPPLKNWTIYKSRFIIIQKYSMSKLLNSVAPYVPYLEAWPTSASLSPLSTCVS